MFGLNGALRRSLSWLFFLLCKTSSYRHDYIHMILPTTSTGLPDFQGCPVTTMCHVTVATRVAHNLFHASRLLVHTLNALFLNAIIAVKNSFNTETFKESFTALLRVIWFNRHFTDQDHNRLA